MPNLNQPVAHKGNWKYYLKSFILGFSLFLFVVDLLALIYFLIFVNSKISGLDGFFMLIFGFIIIIVYLLSLIFTIILIHKNKRKWFFLLFSLIFLSIFLISFYLFW
jgi:hypothetical protein